MKLPRDLGGTTLVKALCQSWGYRRANQVGSHAGETDDPSHHRIAIPLHPTLRIGTLNAILRAVARHKGVSRRDVLASL
ncbi:MAG: type II toxin-antitoxin system HicA family toxin [Acidobacteria bacterium]|nr:MAG: type II toxin-antitoxin system HicA family toxin [Acidobacteriota bacterium]